MSTHNSSPKTYGFLVYLPSYDVLICKICQFAIQPTAFSSHLLRHGVYRNRRLELLQQLSRLRLLPPEQVTTPPPGQLPLPDLAVFSGWRCGMAGCDHRCISQKRMMLHRSKSHPETCSRSLNATPVFLQTFFRGNKVRYFEVIRPDDDASLQRSTVKSRSKSAYSRPGSSQDRLLTSEYIKLLNDEGPANASQRPLDMDALKALQRFITLTSKTLSRGTESTHFWAHNVTAEALKYEFLMYGILGVSVLHEASQSDDTKRIQKCQESALVYQSCGIEGFRETMKHRSRDNATALIAFARLVGVQRCAQDLLIHLRFSSSTTEQLSNGIIKPIEFLIMIRGGLEVYLDLQLFLPSASDFILSEHVMKGLRQTDPSGNILDHQDLSDPIYTRLTALAHLISPYMSDSDKPAISAAIGALFISFSRSRQFDEVWALWNGIESWTYMVPEQFVHLLQDSQPAALVVFAHWFVLVKRVEVHYWFMNGKADQFLKTVMDGLDDTLKEGVKDLV